jgi:flagellar hook-basal body complex protein FliE
MSIDTRNLDQMISELRSVSSSLSPKPAAGAPAADGADFASALKTAIDQVSQAQQSAQQMTQEFATGESNVNLQDVMVNLQKANVSFQQMVQVRNKLVSAYNDIINMQV